MPEPEPERAPAGGRPSPVRPALLAAALAVATTLACWAPFLSRPDLFARHFDAPVYLVVAKTLYRPPAVNPLPGYILHPNYFAVAAPLFPLTIRALSLPAGPLWGLAAALLLFVAASAAALVVYARRVVPEVPALVAAAVFCLLPARQVLYRALGSAEAAMALFVLLAAWAWHEERYALAFAASSLASLTRVNGVLLVGVLALLLLAKRRPVLALGGSAAALAPLAALFAWHAHVLGTPLAFLHVHATKKVGAPFGEVAQQLAAGQWEAAELILAIVLVMGLAAARLWTMRLPFKSLVVLAHIGLFSVMGESDLPRWSLSVQPFVFLVAWRELWSGGRAALLLLAAAGTLSIVYAWQSVGENLLAEPVYRHLLTFLGG